MEEREVRELWSIRPGKSWSCDTAVAKRSGLGGLWTQALSVGREQGGAYLASATGSVSLGATLCTTLCSSARTGRRARAVHEATLSTPSAETLFLRPCSKRHGRLCGERRSDACGRGSPHFRYGNDIATSRVVWNAEHRALLGAVAPTVPVADCHGDDMELAAEPILRWTVTAIRVPSNARRVTLDTNSNLRVDATRDVSSDPHLVSSTAGRSDALSMLDWSVTRCLSRRWPLTALHAPAVQQVRKEAWSEHPSAASNVDRSSSRWPRGCVRLLQVLHQPYTSRGWVTDTTWQRMRHHPLLHASFFVLTKDNRAHLVLCAFFVRQESLVDEAAQARRRQLRFGCATVVRSMMLTRRDDDRSGRKDFRQWLE